MNRPTNPSTPSPQHDRPHLGTGGSCTLVGAGPGDPELLTLKALKAIQAATVLLVDDLVSDAIVAHASPKARIIYVGKRGGCKSTPQAFIEKLMIMAVNEGEQVVRLKGGDPFIFGRGGEEVEHLRAAGVPVTVVNGITAGLAGLTSLGAPLTHREHAHGVVFITGHAKPGDAGTDFVYDEMLVTGPGEKGEAIANAVAGDKSLGSDKGPKPGEGPSREERENGFYDVLFLGTDSAGNTLRVGVKGDRDPGYGSTSKMIAEAAICLLQDAATTPGGIWTTAPAMGDKLIARLQANAGLKFGVEGTA